MDGGGGGYGSWQLGGDTFLLLVNVFMDEPCS